LEEVVERKKSARTVCALDFDLHFPDLGFERSAAAFIAEKEP
jgi:hypothetical protein